MLRLERKQSPDMSRGLWIPTIWILYTASKPFGIWFPSMSADVESGSPLDRVFLIILLCVALWILIRRRFDWFTAMRDNAWVIVLLIFMLVSILWSNIPAISFKRWVREFQAIFMAFVVLSESSPRQAVESVIRRSIYVLIPFSLLLIKYFPRYGVDYGTWSGARMWIGVTLQKNGLGRLCLIAVFFLLWSLVRRWQGHIAPVWKYQTQAEILVLVLALWLIKGPGGGGYSATAIAALVVGLLVYLGFYFIKKSGITLGAGTLRSIIVIIIIFGIVALFSGGSNLRVAASAASRDATLTGRTEIWAALLPVAMERPILGNGFGSFWTEPTREMFKVSEAHSGYLDVLLDLGFVGILLVSMFLLSSSRKAQRELAYDYDWATLWICFLIMAVVHNISESSINSLTSHLTAVILFLSISSTNVTSGRQRA
jgi:exopolysaccharide production protein ExoQ